MRFFFFCEKNYAILKSSKAIYSPQNGFLGFFSVTAKRDLSKVTAEEPFWRSWPSDSWFDRQHFWRWFRLPLLAVQGPCTHKWSLVWRTPRNNAWLLCLNYFVLNPCLFNSFLIPLSTGEKIPGFLFPRIPRMTDNLDLAPCLCQVSVPLAALLLSLTENAAAAVGPEASELSDSVTTQGTLDHWFYPH